MAFIAGNLQYFDLETVLSADTCIANLERCVILEIDCFRERNCGILVQQLIVTFSNSFKSFCMLVLLGICDFVYLFWFVDSLFSILLIDPYGAWLITFILYDK